MANSRSGQSGGKRPGPGGTGAKPAGSAKPAGAPAGKAGKSGKPGSSGSTMARSSVASARRQSASSNRTQLIIGGIAVVLIAAVVVLGLVLNRQQTAVQGEGYGPSTKSVATLADGVVTVSAPGVAAGTASIDLFEDPMCPACAQFEEQFGQQINQAVDEGRLVVRVHMLDFLNRASASGDYSTRAIAATQCVAQNSGSSPGVYMVFRESLFASGTQPAENGSSDLSNQQLAELATTAGASAAVECITAGTNVDAATASAAASNSTLSAATGGRVLTPSVLKDGAPVQPLSVDWLSTLLGTS